MRQAWHRLGAAPGRQVYRLEGGHSCLWGLPLQMPVCDRGITLLTLLRLEVAKHEKMPTAPTLQEMEGGLGERGRDLQAVTRV